MPIKYHTNLTQGTDEWFAARCGLLTASEMKLIITPTLKAASNDKERAHLYELAAQRITQYVEPSYIGEDMLRGMRDEVDARILYSEKYAPVDECGFITNDAWGFTLGYSPDGLVGDDGQIEVKSRKQKTQIETILSNQVPDADMIQVQSGLLVSGRSWCDYISYCAGLPMFTILVYPDLDMQAAILDASRVFHGKLDAAVASYEAMLKTGARLIPTERKPDVIGELFSGREAA